MFCSRCGIENADDALFCKNCGERLAQSTNGVPESGTAPGHKPTSFAGAVIKTLSSSKMLALCIIYTISAGVGLISTLLDNAVTETVLSQMFNNYGVFFPQDGVISVLTAGGLVRFIPAAITVTGFWLAFSAAKNAGINGTMKTGGLTAIKVILSIKMAVMIIGAALIALVFGMGAAMGNINVPSTGTDLTDFGEIFGAIDAALGDVIGIIVLLSLAAAFIVLAVYTVFLALAVREIGNIAQTVRYNAFYRNVSMGAVVFAFICAGGNVFSGSLLNGAAYVLVAVVLLDLRNNINSVPVSPCTYQ